MSARAARTAFSRSLRCRRLSIMAKTETPRPQTQRMAPATPRKMSVEGIVWKLAQTVTLLQSETAGTFYRKSVNRRQGEPVSTNCARPATYHPTSGIEAGGRALFEESQKTITHRCPWRWLCSVLWPTDTIQLQSVAALHPV